MYVKSNEFDQFIFNTMSAKGVYISEYFFMFNILRDINKHLLEKYLNYFVRFPIVITKNIIDKTLTNYPST